MTIAMTFTLSRPLPPRMHEAYRRPAASARRPCGKVDFCHSQDPFPRLIGATCVFVHAVNRIPILTYHALHAPGDDYASNDHAALETDMAVLRRLGFRIAPLADVAAYAADNGARYLEQGTWAALSFDDGTDWDYHDYDYDGRCIKSFYTILKEAAVHGESPPPTAVSFVIASPEARRILDRTCIAGRDNWRDSWWSDATRSGVLGIGNHSWDHVHDTLPTVAQREQRKGTFLGVDSLADADIQIRQAEQFICARAGATTRLFAYPYGEAPDYLVADYFPNHRERHGIVAAFVTGGDYATRRSNRWKIPRFVCGEHWKTPDELARILTAANSPR